MTDRRRASNVVARLSLSRRQLLGGLGAALGLAGCERFDAMSWVTRERFDVDRRFRESTEEIASPLPPPLRDESHWSALIVSDLHFFDDEANVNVNEIADYLAEEPVDFMFQLGDLADAGWPIEYQTATETLEALGVPLFHAIGNHDVYHEGWASFRLHCGPSLFPLTVGNVLFIVLDLAGGTLGGLQRPWLEEQLQAATEEHILLLSHYPLWSPTDEGFSQIASEQEVYDILDLMRQYGVAAHVSGHTHRWAFTEINGSALYTVSAMKESSSDRCGLRVDVDRGELSLTRIPFGGSR
jgi:UDP-2,3-diacylglucosamine pyrophosphatase LpxH